MNKNGPGQGTLNNQRLLMPFRNRYHGLDKHGTVRMEGAWALERTGHSRGQNRPKLQSSWTNASSGAYGL